MMNEIEQHYAAVERIRKLVVKHGDLEMQKAFMMIMVITQSFEYFLNKGIIPEEQAEQVAMGIVDATDKAATREEQVNHVD